MKKNVTAFFASALIVLSSTAHAQNRVLTVDNNPGALAMFSNAWTAYGAAIDGDTILLSGSETPYIIHGPIQKKLHWIGNGYFLEENQIPGLSKKSAKLIATQQNPQLYFTSDQESGSSASGTTITGVEFQAEVYAGVPMSLDRCKAPVVADRLSPHPGAEPGRLTIRRCHLGNVSLSAPGSILHNSIANIADLGAGTTAANCVFTCYVWSRELASVSSSIFALQCDPVPTAAKFREDFRGSVTHSMAVRGSFLPESSGNINGIAELSDVFVAEGSHERDAYWQLKPGSPAIDQGLNGVDMGAFDGLTPYLLSGVPSLPRITRLEVPAVATSESGLRFEVDAQAF